MWMVTTPRPPLETNELEATGTAELDAALVVGAAAALVLDDLLDDPPPHADTPTAIAAKTPTSTIR
jgi:hypothetical protein